MAEKRNRWGAEPQVEAVPQQVDMPAKRNRWSAEPQVVPEQILPAQALVPVGQAAPAMSGQQPPLARPQAMPAAQPSSMAMQALAAFQQKANLNAHLERLRQERQPVAPKLIIDSMGRELDENGKVIPMKAPQIATLKVNQKQRAGVGGVETGKSQAANTVGSTAPSGTASHMTGISSIATGISSFVNGVQTVVNKQGIPVMHSAKHFDPSVRLPGAGTRDRRKVMGFRFVQDDRYIKQEEEKQREEAQKVAAKLLEEKKKKEEEGLKDGSGASGPQLIAMGTKATKAAPAPVPDSFEWWDTFIISKTDMESIDESKITKYVEHPVPIKPSLIKQKSNEKSVQSMLTPQERKKLRRRNRQERAQQIRDKIQMGLLQPPPPKVKFANLMRVMGDEQIANPTAVEAKVRAQTEQRKKDHEQRNQQNKLDPEERKKKKKQRWDGNTLGGPAPKTDGKAPINMTHCLVFDLRDVSNKKHLYKVNTNAEQFQLTGCLVMCPGLANLLVVEGGQRAITRYKKLILRRIKWKEAAGGEDMSDDDEAEEHGRKNANESVVSLMWEGSVQKRQFDSFKVHTVKTEQEARAILVRAKCETYWTMLERHRDANQDL